MLKMSWMGIIAALVMEVCGGQTVNAATQIARTTRTSPRGIAVCEKKINMLIVGLESTLIAVEGSISGDYAELPLTITLEKTTEKGGASELLTYSIAVEHTNDDNENWTNAYTVVMEGRGDYCWLSTYSYSGSR